MILCKQQREMQTVMQADSHSTYYLECAKDTIASGGSHKANIKEGTEWPPFPSRFNREILTSCLTTTIRKYRRADKQTHHLRNMKVLSNCTSTLPSYSPSISSIFKTRRANRRPVQYAGTSILCYYIEKPMYK